MLRFRVPQAEIEEKARKILHEVLARIFLDTPVVTHDQLLGLICDTMHRLAPGTAEAPSSTRMDSRSAGPAAATPPPMTIRLIPRVRTSDRIARAR